jgi:hypothetical protein
VVGKGEEESPAIPLTKVSRVLRRGRGARSDVVEEVVPEEEVPQDQFQDA